MNLMTAIGEVHLPVNPVGNRLGGRPVVTERDSQVMAGHQRGNAEASAHDQRAAQAIAASSFTRTPAAFLQ